MKQAELEALTIVQLEALATKRGLVVDRGLSPDAHRSSLIARLVDAPSGTHGTEASDAEKRAQVSVSGHDKEHRGPESAASKPAGQTGGGSPTQWPRGSGLRPPHEPLHAVDDDEPTVPSTTTPDRPMEHSPLEMARLYLAQGEPARAVEIFHELLQLHPGDRNIAAQKLHAEAQVALLDAAASTGLESMITDVSEDVQTTSEMASRAARAQPTPGKAPPGEPLGMLDFEEVPDGYGVDECEVISKDPFHVFVYWEVTEAGLSRARGDLGDEAGSAKLVMRMLATTPPGERGPERENRDFPLDGWRGRRYLQTPKPGMRVRAAIGLVTPSGLFAPITNSSQIRVPPEGPAPAPAREWMEVAPPRTGGREREPIEIVTRGPGPVERGPQQGDDEGGENSPEGRGPQGPSSPTSPWRWRSGRDG